MGRDVILGAESRTLNYQVLCGRVGRALDWRPGRPGFESRYVATSLRNFGNSVYPALPVSFGAVVA